ncbi:universal stress protein [Nitrospira lenta]|uniref:Putative Universal stress protein n=1 Tax=Nitrospira lenta TaxID=1436998 RepID=A0A330L1J5_9BACT|nr:universal stress protein [Nitrospira lenta]SPP63129.1 putative Universal stress protein [Nitrospira lenta]
MKIVAGIDWSDEAFAAVKQLGLLYKPDEVLLVHGVDLGMFQSPLMAGVANLQGYDEFRASLIEAGRQAVERGRTVLPADIPSVTTKSEPHHAASFILDSAEASAADLIVVGTHDHSRLAEFFVGSVSHHVLLHSRIPTLIVKGNAKPVARVLLAIEGRDDAARVQSWLTAHPFRNPVALTLLSIVPSLTMVEPDIMAGYHAWAEEHTLQTERILAETARALGGPQFTVTTQVRSGDPVTAICEAAGGYDLLIAGSHSRTRVDRFLLGSVSHGIVHKAGCSVLVIR